MTETETDFEAERSRLIRETLQRLESLSRAGASTLPRVAFEAAAVSPAAPTPARIVEPAALRPAEPEPIEPSTSFRSSPPPSAAPALSPAPRRLFSDSGPAGPIIPPEERPALLADLAVQAAECRRCPHLADRRTQTVFGAGSPTARLMFIGEAPGEEEDRTGVPFVGPAGRLLTDMITKGMGLAREDVYIANILKCRPPNNRDPSPEESSNCLPYLERQIEIVRPEFICLLGKVAATTMLNTGLSLGRLRKKWHRIQGVPTIATYHPSYLLRTPSAKKDAWEDLQMLMRAMGLPIRGRKEQAE